MATAQCPPIWLNGFPIDMPVAIIWRFGAPIDVLSLRARTLGCRRRRRRVGRRLTAHQTTSVENRFCVLFVERGIFTSYGQRYGKTGYPTNVANQICEPSYRWASYQSNRILWRWSAGCLHFSIGRPYRCRLGVLQEMTLVAASSRKPSASRVAFKGTISSSYMRFFSSMTFFLFLSSPRNRRMASRPTASGFSHGLGHWKSSSRMVRRSRQTGLRASATVKLVLCIATLALNAGCSTPIRWRTASQSQLYNRRSHCAAVRSSSFQDSTSFCMSVRRRIGAKYVDPHRVGDSVSNLRGVQR